MYDFVLKIVQTFVFLIYILFVERTCPSVSAGGLVSVRARFWRARFRERSEIRYCRFTTFTSPGPLNTYESLCEHRAIGAANRRIAEASHVPIPVEVRNHPKSRFAVPNLFLPDLANFFSFHTYCPCFGGSSV